MFEGNMGSISTKKTVFVGILFRNKEKTVVILDIYIYIDKLYPNTETVPYRCENKVYRLRKYGSSLPH